MTERLWSGTTDTRNWQCDHCGYPIPDTETALTNRDQRFCAEACLEAAADGDRSFVNRQGYKRFWTGVSVLDDLVPNGLPTNALFGCAGPAGSRRPELLTELAWRSLERGEPTIIIAAETSPMTVLERFFTLGWNPIPALEDGRLRLIDCLSEQLTNRRAAEEGFNEWNRFLSATATDAIDTVDLDTQEPFLETLEAAIEELEMAETGLVTVDSVEALTEPSDSSEVPAAKANRAFLREIRELVCTARFVPVFIGVDPDTIADRTRTSMLFGGLFDLRLTTHPESGLQLKQLRIRRLVGTQMTPRWVSYESATETGLFTLDPTADLCGTYGVDSEQ